MLDPVPWIRVGGEPLRQLSSTTRLADPIQSLEHLRHFSHVVVLAQRIAEAALVGLILRVPAVLEEEQAEPRPRQLPELGDVRGENAADAQAELGQLGLADLLDRMPVGDVGDLVSDDRGELRLGIDGAHQPTGHVDEATRNRERVDRGVVHHMELPGQVGPLGLCRHPLADVGNVGLDLRVIVEADRLGHFLGPLLAHLDLLRLGDQRQLALAGDRVAGAAQGAGHQAGAEPRNQQGGKERESGKAQRLKG